MSDLILSVFLPQLLVRQVDVHLQQTVAAIHCGLNTTFFRLCLLDVVQLLGRFPKLNVAVEPS
ncbi:hypothetical protein D3C72_1765800 [compost metagenome]